MRLPLGAEDVPMPAPGPVLTPPEAADRRRWRVLIVDDYIDAAKGLQTLLELDDHVVEVAHDGAEALAKARDFRPHLVFCDINLPLVDGFKVARQLRAEEDFGSLFSSRSRDSARRRMRRAAWQRASTGTSSSRSIRSASRRFSSHSSGGWPELTGGAGRFHVIQVCAVCIMETGWGSTCTFAPRP